MGNQQSGSKQSLKCIAYGYYQLKITNGITFVRKSYVVHSQQQKKSFKDLVSIIKDLDIPTIVQIYDLIQNGFSMQLQYQYCPQTLQDQIELKNKTYFKYSEKQIYNFIDCVLSGLMAFSFKTLNHKDLRPSNILIGYHQEDKSTKLYKIGYPLLMNTDTMEKEYSKNKISNIYFGPQLYQSLAKMVANSYSLQKNDVFSLGLITLKMATLRNVESIYNHSTGEISLLQLSKYLKICEENYTKNLAMLLREMLQIDEKTRPSFSQIFEVLQPLLNQNFSQSFQQKQRGNSKKLEILNIKGQKNVKKIESGRSKYIPTFCHVRDQYFLKQIYNRIQNPDEVQKKIQIQKASIIQIGSSKKKKK